MSVELTSFHQGSVSVPECKFRQSAFHGTKKDPVWPPATLPLRHEPGPTILGTKFHELLFNGLEKQGFGKWGFTADPYEMARMMIAHIDKKRKALGIDKARDRVLMDMADRQNLDVA